MRSLLPHRNSEATVKLVQEVFVLIPFQASQKEKLLEGHTYVRSPVICLVSTAKGKQAKEDYSLETKHSIS